ncbi:DUF4430 domain-containing protein [Patescibacteria group bacterium]|nr:DUF4430 domain-containing protein [Patescibacteria group bacterium]MBU4014824.1 DUF4430 domain-containing protein [Patescibacteria group bacterium]MBU4026629.1 DUF4430 domain-containing protein [Patescibacteria group bacterium]MBU4073528.1 DUF4430 domain-containing protein [Patescibacteria group bacterium]MBU4124687.1 DUF4430 domain-containing protein [Patescibacteria group bacterium]
MAKIIILIAVFFTGFIFGQQYAAEPAVQDSQPIVCQQEQEQEYASLIFDFGDEDIKTFSDIAIGDNDSVFEVLQKAVSENNIELNYKDYGGDMGVFIESINGKRNDFDSGYYWQYWVNGQYAKVGASSYELQNGDVVEWKYAEGQID